MNGLLPTLLSLNGMVAAAHPLASAAGVEVLRGGGNAFDAAAATAAALNVVEPYMSGLAGAGIAICYVAKEKRVRVLNFVPDFPADFDPRAFAGERATIRRGGYGVGLPGCLAGWAELVAAYGTLPFGDALLPALRLARGGFGLSELNVRALRDSRTELRTYPDLYPGWAALYENPAGEWGIGTVLRQPALAGTLEAIATHGVSHLYGGPVGAAMVGAARANGGCLTENDVARIKPQWQEPIAARYRDHKVFTTPTPSHGRQFLTSLRLFENATPKGLPEDETDRADRLFRCLRVAARARIERHGRGLDASFVSEDTIRDLSEQLYSEVGSCGPTEYSGRWGHHDESRENTTSFTTGDKDGNLVAITQSLGQYFGSGVVLSDHGVVLNDLLHYGYLGWQTGKRQQALDLPLCPAIAEVRGRGRLAYGTPGSFGISQTQAQVLINFADRGMRLQQAFDEPRARLMPGRKVLIESRLVAGHDEGLKARGHSLEIAEEWTKIVGGMHGIFCHADTGLLEGAADRRRDGYVALQ